MCINIYMYIHIQKEGQRPEIDRERERSYVKLRDSGCYFHINVMHIRLHLFSLTS